MVDAAQAKRELRNELKAARALRSASEREAAGAALARRGVDRWATATRVAGFLSFGDEPPSRPLLDALVSRGAEVVVPVVTGPNLDWVSYLPGCPVTTGWFGVEEPTGPPLGPAAIDSADLILVPALAVDRTGTRLGRGRGYYDRALSGLSTTTVAIVYDEELLDLLPVEPHDRPVQGALLPSGYVPL